MIAHSKLFFQVPLKGYITITGLKVGTARFILAFQEISQLFNCFKNFESTTNVFKNAAEKLVIRNALASYNTLMVPRFTFLR